MFITCSDYYRIERLVGLFHLSVCLSPAPSHAFSSNGPPLVVFLHPQVVCSEYIHK